MVTLGSASAAVSSGVRTLVVDMDSQGNASDALLADLEGAPEATSCDVLLGKRGCAPAAIAESPWGVGVIAGSLDLASFERADALASAQRLRAGPDTPKLDGAWDLCLIDCPPSLGLLVHAALVAADEALIVTEPSLSASQGVSNVYATVATIREHYHPQLAVSRIVVYRVVAANEPKLRGEALGAARGSRRCASALRWSRLSAPASRSTSTGSTSARSATRSSASWTYGWGASWKEQHDQHPAQGLRAPEAAPRCLSIP